MGQVEVKGRIGVQHFGYVLGLRKIMTAVTQQRLCSEVYIFLWLADSAHCREDQGVEFAHWSQPCLLACAVLTCRVALPSPGHGRACPDGRST